MVQEITGINDKGVEKYIIEGIIQGINIDLVEKNPSMYAFVGSNLNDYYLAYIELGKVQSKIHMPTYIGDISEVLIKSKKVLKLYDEKRYKELVVLVGLASKKEVQKRLRDLVNKHNSIDLKNLTKQDIKRMERCMRMVMDKSILQNLKIQGVDIKVTKNSGGNYLYVSIDNIDIIVSPLGILKTTGDVIYKRESEFSSVKDLKENLPKLKELGMGVEKIKVLGVFLTECYDLRKNLSKRDK